MKSYFASFRCAGDQPFADSGAIHELTTFLSDLELAFPTGSSRFSTMISKATFVKMPVVLASAFILTGANNSDVLFASEANVFEAVAELGAAWRSHPTLTEFPRPRPPFFMPYALDSRRAVFIHRDESGQINRVLLSDLGCWAEDREGVLRTVIRMSDALPEALHNLRFASSLVFDRDAKLMGVQAAPRLRIMFQRSSRNSRCSIDMRAPTAWN